MSDFVSDQIPWEQWLHDDVWGDVGDTSADGSESKSGHEAPNDDCIIPFGQSDSLENQGPRNLPFDLSLLGMSNELGNHQGGPLDYMPDAIQSHGNVNSFACDAIDYQQVSSAQQDDLKTLAAEFMIAPSLPTATADENNANPTSEKKEKKTELLCTFPGCNLKKVFRRRYELVRHMSKHAPETAYDCPVVACNRRGATAFYREDKLTAHLRAAHEDEERSACPVTGCGRQLPLESLRVHVHTHNDHAASEVHLLKVCAAKVRPCPVDKCRHRPSRWMRTGKIPGPKGHLMSHDEGERHAQRAEISAKGYDATSGALICPVCKTLCSGEPEFRKHLSDSHMMVTDHARLFVDAVRLSGPSWSDWSILGGTSPHHSLKCPVCSHEHFVWSPEAVVDAAARHPGLLVHTEELYHHRLEILRLLPEFHAHPVFNGIRQTS